MKLFKQHIEETKGGELEQIEDLHGEGYCVTIQSIFYSSTSPNSYLRLFDKDGHQFMFKIPGQGGEGVDQPNPVTPEIPVTVALPLSYYDDSGQNEVIIWGEVYKVDLSLDSSF